MTNKSQIEKTLSQLLQEHGLNKTIMLNGLLLTFEKDRAGIPTLYIYNNGDYDSFELSFDKTSEFPICCKYIDKQLSDKIIGCIMNWLFS